VKRCIEIFPVFFLGKNKFCYKEPLKILKGLFSSSVCDLVEIYRLISYSFGKFKSFGYLIAKVTPEIYYS
jgi:hypothetical protein